MNSGARLGGTILRTLPTLLFIAGVCWVVLSRPGQHRRDLDASAESVYRGDDGRVLSVTFIGRSPRPELIENFPSLRRLVVQDAPVDADLFKSVARLTGLTSLSLAGSTFRAQHLSLLNTIGTLRELDLSNTPDLSAHLPSLQLPLLEILKLNDCPWLTDRDLAGVSAFPKLLSLEASHGNLTDAGIKYLSGLPKLQSMDLSGCRHIGDAALNSLADVSSLRVLTLSGQTLTLAAARRFQTAQPSVRLCTPLADFPELRPLMAVDHSGYRYANPARPRFFSEGLVSLDIEDEAGLDYSPLQYFPDLTSLSLTGPGVNDAAIGYLSEMTQLKSLRLSRSRVTDDGLAGLAGLKTLQELFLNESCISGTGLAFLSRLTQLKTLDLNGIPADNVDLEQISMLTNLTTLRLRGIPLSDRDLSVLEHLSAPLKEIDISACGVTENGLKRLPGKDFQTVILSELPLDDSDLEVVTTWKNLRVLDLSGTDVTGAGLRLDGNDQLEVVLLDRSQVSDQTLPFLTLPTRLRHLSLAGTTITGRTLSALESVRLSSLDVSHTPLSSDGVINAFRLQPSLLDLTGVNVMVELPSDITGIHALAINADAPLLNTVLPHSVSAGVKSLTLVGELKEMSLAAVAGFRELQTLNLKNATLSRDITVLLSQHPGLINLRLQDCILPAGAIEQLATSASLMDIAMVGGDVRLEEQQAAQAMNPNLRLHVMTPEFLSVLMRPW